MTAERRLDTLLKGLDAEERALLRLRAFKAGEKDDPQLQPSTPPSQIDTVNAASRLVNATQLNVTWNALWLDARLDAVAALIANLWSIHAAAFVPEFAPGTKHGRVLGEVRRATELVITERLAALWAELLAWAADDCGGEEPCLPTTRTLLDELQRSAVAQRARLAELHVEVMLPAAPDAATVARLKPIIEASRDGRR
jgi:hypothetical protein